MRQVDARHPAPSRLRRAPDRPDRRTTSSAPAASGSGRARAAVLERARLIAGRERFELAATVEFIHTATLLHDDVVDESAICGAAGATANALFGNAASVLVGDFVYSRAFQMMVSAVAMRVMEVLPDATNVIAEGEVLQLMNMHDPDVTVEDLSARHPLQDRQAVRGQRAHSARCSPKPTPQIEEACAEYGRSLGTAFQLIDDLLDYDGRRPSSSARTSATICAKASPRCRCSIAMERGTAAATRAAARRHRARRGHGASPTLSKRSCAPPAPWTATREARPQPRRQARCKRSSCFPRFHLP